MEFLLYNGKETLVFVCKRSKPTLKSLLGIWLGWLISVCEYILSINSVLFIVFINWIHNWTVLQSFPNLILLDGYSLGCGHYEFTRIIKDEVSLIHFALIFWYDIWSISLDRFTQTPDDCILSESTNYEPFQIVVTFIEFSRQKAKVLQSKFLQVFKRYAQLDRSGPVSEIYFFIKKWNILVGLRGNKSQVSSKGCQGPPTIFRCINMNHCVSIWAKFVICIFAYLFIKSYLAFPGSSYEITFTSGAHSDEFRINLIVLQAAYTLLGSRINLV